MNIPRVHGPLPVNIAVNQCDFPGGEPSGHGLILKLYKLGDNDAKAVWRYARLVLRSPRVKAVRSDDLLFMMFSNGLIFLMNLLSKFITLFSQYLFRLRIGYL